MGAKRIPHEVAAAIGKCWPGGEVGEFDTDESYFRDIHRRLERDLRRIAGASLLWQTEADETRSSWDNDDWEDEPPPRRDFQSYHVFFLAPHGDEFQFEAETESPEEPEDPEDDELTTATYAGKGWRGCIVGISLVAPVAVIILGDYSEFEDGSASTPDPEPSMFSPKTGQPVDTTEYYRKALGEKAFRKLETLRQKTTAVLTKHHIRLLDHSILHLPVPALKASEDLFLEKPLRVRDAFFFRGV